VCGGTTHGATVCIAACTVFMRPTCVIAWFHFHSRKLEATHLLHDTLGNLPTAADSKQMVNKKPAQFSARKATSGEKDLQSGPPKKKNKRLPKEDNDLLIQDSFDENFHRPSTKNWDTSVETREMLPIKINGKVIKKTKVVSNRKLSEDDEEEDEDDSDHIEEGEGEEREEDNEFLLPEKANFDTIDNRPIKSPSSTVETAKLKKFQALDLQKKKLLIAEICHAIIQDPMKALKKRRSTDPSTSAGGDEDDSEEDKDYRITDVFAFLQDPNPQIQEIAMLSCFLIFKDICPGYKIRKQDSSDTSVQHKKDTKRLRDFDLSILSNYNFFLKFLQKKVTDGLGSIKRTEPMVDPDSGNILTSWQLGVSALRLQCELLKSLSHFNYRSNLLKSIITRTGQFLPSISKICLETLEYLFTSGGGSGSTRGGALGAVDSAELTFEIIQSIGSYLTSMKYQVHENLLLALNSTQLKVHHDQGKEIRKKVKQQRRKRQRDEEDIEANLQETDGMTQAFVAKRYQADALHEVCIIYFRYGHTPLPTDAILRSSLSTSSLPPSLPLPPSLS
jgi:hypothetical protein